MDGRDMRMLIHMKKMSRIVKDKRYFDREMKRIERYLLLKSRGLVR